jgi:hypothetical protein
MQYHGSACMLLWTEVPDSNTTIWKTLVKRFIVQVWSKVRTAELNGLESFRFKKKLKKMVAKERQATNACDDLAKVSSRERFKTPLAKTQCRIT